VPVTGTVHACEAVNNFILMPVAEVVKVTRSPAVTESVTSENALNVNALVAAPFVQSTKVTSPCDLVGKGCQGGSGRNIMIHLSQGPQWRVMFSSR